MIDTKETNIKITQGAIPVNDDLVLHEHEDVGVHPEHLEKLPAVVRLYTMDSFDRAGDAKMFELTIAPLKELTSKPLPL